MAQQTQTSKHVLEVASELFYREGIRAIGVDTIVARSQVGKATLYRHYPTRDDLIIAYLQAGAETYLSWFDQIIAPYPKNVAAQLQTFLHATQEKVTQPGYRGCPFVNALIEYGDPQHPIHQAALAVKLEVHRRLLLLCQKLKGANPETLANQLLLLVNGAEASAPHFGDQGPAHYLVQMGNLLLAPYLTA